MRKGFAHNPRVVSLHGWFSCTRRLHTYISHIYDISLMQQLCREMYIYIYIYPWKLISPIPQHANQGQIIMYPEVDGHTNEVRRT
jgi:hypothetical protein